MKFTSAATTALPFLITLSHPRNISARLSAPGSIIDDGEMKNGKDEARYLMWDNNDSQQESVLDDVMKARLANGKKHINTMNNKNQDDKARRILPSNNSQKGHDMVCSNPFIVLPKYYISSLFLTY